MLGLGRLTIGANRSLVAWPSKADASTDCRRPDNPVVEYNHIVECCNQLFEAVSIDNLDCMFLRNLGCMCLSYNHLGNSHPDSSYNCLCYSYLGLCQVLDSCTRWTHPYLTDSIH